MKIKIIVTLLILMFSINTSLGDTGTFYLSDSFSNTDSAFPKSSLGSKIISYNQMVCNVDTVGNIQVVTMEIPLSIWGGSSLNCDSEEVNLKIGGTIIGEGITFFSKSSTQVFIVVIVDNIDFTGYSGYRQINIDSKDGSNLNMKSLSRTFTEFTGTPNNKIAYIGSCVYGTALQMSNYAGMKMHTSSLQTFENTYTYIKHDNYLEFVLNRNAQNPSKILINNSQGTILDESTGGYLTNELSFNSLDTSYLTWDLTLYTYLGNTMYTTIIYKDDTPSTNCYIQVDNTDIGDTINVSYFNINDLRENPLSYGNSLYATCDLNIQVIADRGYYEELIYQDLIIDETDKTFYYSSDSLTPGTYYAQINRNLGGLTDYAVRSTFTISEPTNYSIIVNPDTCYVGDKINIIYKSLNMSSLSVYDDNDKLIDNWLNIQGQSQKIYQVPPDYEYNNAYSNWYVMLNDTGNSSNTHRYNFTVNWKIYVEPEPTPEPTESYFNVSIEENIEELKNGINPVLELIFGISTIFVENPDYNNDDIVDVNELSTWINSIVSIAIVIFLFILYKVYKRR